GAAPSSATRGSASAWRADRATSAPASASRSAIARPIPRLAPVTTAVLPASGPLTGCLATRHLGDRAGRAGRRSPLLVLVVERLHLRRLIVAELAAALLRREIVGVDDAGIPIG